MKRTVICVALTALALSVMTAAWAQPYVKPTTQHELLFRDVGAWDAEFSFLPAPDAEPVTGTGIETVEPLGTMWVTSTFEGKFGGHAYRSKSLMGYDPVKKKYVTASCDTTSPFLNTMEGDYDTDTRTLTLSAETTDPTTGQPMKGKLVLKLVDDDTRLMEGFGTVPGEPDKWQKVLDATYKRRK